MTLRYVSEIAVIHVYFLLPRIPTVEYSSVIYKFLLKGSKFKRTKIYLYNTRYLKTEYEEVYAF